MPVLGLGTWELTRDTPGSVERALDLGYRMIDTSGDYGTQPGVGEGIRRSGLDRDELYVVTKVEEDEDAYRSTVENLDELGMEHADLMLVHRPPAEGAGEGLWAGLIRAQEEGLATDIGVSNYSTAQIDELIRLTGETPVVNQIEWSPFGWSQEMLDFCRDHRIVIQAYSPLTRGNRLKDPRLSALAAEYQRTPAQLLIRRDTQMGNAPLPKANQPAHMEENLGFSGFEIAD
ncbi:MAG TPA: aldo/keto reductase, partial [Longimicrobiales bacterium]|nr:aldo/keto reductase [Longimicrobiales bacterium]